MTLNELREGDRAIIEKVRGNGSFRQRLLEMGFQPGQELYVEKYAPLKDPIELVIMGYHLSLRREEGKSIHVKKINGKGCLRQKRKRNRKRRKNKRCRKKKY
jgi:Fe2+ transport system protein FeoA